MARLKESSIWHDSQRSFRVSERLEDVLLLGLSPCRPHPFRELSPSPDQRGRTCLFPAGGQPAPWLGPQDQRSEGSGLPQPSPAQQA